MCALTLLALPFVLSMAIPVSAGAGRKPAGPSAVTVDNETRVLYDDEAGGSGDDPAIWVHPGDCDASIVIVSPSWLMGSRS
jgi:3-phytase